MFRLAIITPPEDIRDEAHALTAICRLQGVEVLHLRKPTWSEEKTRRFLDLLPVDVLGRIRLHDYFGLWKTYGLQGVHLNRRNGMAPDNCPHSASCHNEAETIREKAHCDYVFLSPIFDSISKQGYKSGFSENRLQEASRKGILDPQVLALGGVEACHIPFLKKLGFGGAAMLGGIWKPYMETGNLQGLCRNIETILNLCRD